MENAMAELPLAIFTTLAPISAGAFIALALAFFTATFTDEQLKKIDRMTLIPLVLLAVGFLASFLHLADVGHSFFVFDRIGASPLSNEILVGIIFCVVALIYWIVAMVGKLSIGARKVLAVIVALVGLVFAVFTGMAYMMYTIPSWNNALSPLQVIGLCLLGGALLGSFVLSLAGSFKDAKETGFKTAIFAMTVVGAIIALVGVIGQVVMVSGMQNSLVYGSDLVGQAMVFFVVFIIATLAAVVLEWYALNKKASTKMLCLGAVVAVVAVFCARLVFYALELSVGLSI